MISVDRYVMAAFLIFVTMNALDVMTSLIGFQLGAIEGDAETLFLMNKLGVVELLLLKFFLVVFVGLIAVYFQARSSLDYRIFLVGFGLGVGYYVKVLINNIVVIWSLL
jgi:hypothetical protein